MQYFFVFLCAFVLSINVILVHRLFNAEGEWRQYQAMSSQLRIERVRQHDLLEENRRLSAEVVDLKQGHEILEEVARFDLGLMHEGEFFINLFNDSRDGTTDTLSGSNSER